MRFSELIRRITPSFSGEGVPLRVEVAGDPEILGISEDSRKVKAGDLFIARQGSRTSGGRFAADAVGKGAVAVVCAEAMELPAGVAFAVVPDANRAAALLAHGFLGNPARGMKVIAVTGTKGKTTVAYLLRSILKAAGHGCGMIGTVEIDDGRRVVPAEMTTPSALELAELFAAMQRNGVSHCVMEVSSHALHQHRTAGLEFAVAIFTNLTGDHLDYHKTMDDYAAAKAMLFEGLSRNAVAVLNADDMWAHRMAQNCHAKIVRYGVGAGGSRVAGYTGLIQKITSGAMQLLVRSPAELDMSFYTPLIGKHNAYNLLAVIAAADGLGVLRSVTVGELQQNTGAPGRLEPVIPAGVRREEMAFQVFVDYAHTHDALHNVLSALRTTMKESGKAGRLLCVFGCGGDRDRSKRPKMGRIAQELADEVILTSDNPRTEDPLAIIEEVCGGFTGDWKRGPRIAVEPDRRAAIQKAIGLARAGDVVLIAGKGHENYQIVGTTKQHFDDVEEAAVALKMVGEEARSLRGVDTMGAAT